MATVVVCEDDEVLRNTIADLCEDVGLQVLAVTDRASDAVELVRRFDVNILILDLMLHEGTGEGALGRMDELQLRPTTVVFTSYASDPARLQLLGASTVIDKPDLTGLTDVLAELARGDVHAGGGERRSAVRSIKAPPPLWCSPSGLASASDLDRSLEHTVVGDTILTASLREPEEALGRMVDELLVADLRLLLGRLLRATLRAHDSLHVSADQLAVIGVLRGGHEATAGAVWRRFCQREEVAGLPGRLLAAATLVDDGGPRAAVERTLRAVRQDGSHGPTLLSV
ncbi:MAG TPA: response regulator [Acidimicrobiales bacterium]|nr:response regulator [Acidimicrobiales bacterium]